MKRAWACYRSCVVLAVVCLLASPPVAAQGSRRFLPDRSLMPDLWAGPRDPVTKGQLLAVPRNPNAHGDGWEAEVALGTTLPILLLAGRSKADAVLVGVEAAAFARFTLEVLERELVATDWVFAVPVVWRRGDDWIRLRYYHTSSHLGDEYARRFDAQGINFARDAVDLFGWGQFARGVGGYAGVRWAYNVHPEDSGRWIGRLGAQLGDPTGRRTLLPYGSVDVEFDEDIEWEPRIHLQAGFWLPPLGGRRALRAGVSFLVGPSPLGQFQGLPTTQISLGVAGNL